MINQQINNHLESIASVRSCSYEYSSRKNGPYQKGQQPGKFISSFVLRKDKSDLPVRFVLERSALVSMYSVRSLPERSTPASFVPVRSQIPDKSMPVRFVLERSAPVSIVPVRSLPERSTPALVLVPVRSLPDQINLLDLY